jgi:HEPN domain-containing protein
MLKIAEADIKVAHILLKHEPIVAIIMNYSRQSVEKSLKGYLIFNGKEIQRTTDLAKLLNECIKIDSNFDQIIIPAMALNPFSSKILYPGNFSVPLDLSMAEDGIQQAIFIHNFVKDRI